VQSGLATGTVRQRSEGEAPKQGQPPVFKLETLTLLSGTPVVALGKLKLLCPQMDSKTVKVGQFYLLPRILFFR
jgi:hypothetical protein